MFSVEIRSHCIKEKNINLEYQEKINIGYILSFKFKGRAIWPPPGSFRVKGVEVESLTFGSGSFMGVEQLAEDQRQTTYV